jgi:hypothetical protein
MPDAPRARWDRRLAVDFGTTHTVAVLAPGMPLLFDASPLLSSAVAIENGRLLTGRDAVRAGQLDPARYEPNPKLRIDDGRVLLGDASIAVEELIAAPLRRVLTEATRHLGAPPSGMVLTCPAAWGTSRRGVLLRAAEIAGLGAVSLVPEPVAAAWYYASLPDLPALPGHTLAVYDLGGGTFDCTVLRRTDGGWDALATAGRDDVGGIDLDGALLDILAAGAGAQDLRQWRRLVSPTDPMGRRTLQRFGADLRAAKEQLSRRPSVLIHVPLLEVDTHVTREEFDAAVQPLLSPTIELTAQVLHDAGVPPERLDALFLVGGSSRVPLVATLLHRRFGRAPLLVNEPELVVGHGALLAPDAEPPTSVAAARQFGAAPPEPTRTPTAGPAAAPPMPPPVAPATPMRYRGRRWIGAGALLVALVMVAVLLVIWQSGNPGRGLPGGDNPQSGTPGAGAARPVSASVDINKIAWYGGFRVTFGKAEYDPSAKTLTLDLKVKNLLNTDRSLSTISMPISVAFAGQPTPGQFPGTTRTVGADSEIEAKVAFDLTEPVTKLAGGVLSIGSDNELRAQVPIGTGGQLIDLAPVPVLANTSLTVAALRFDRLTCELRGDDPKATRQVPSGSRAIACTFDATYRGTEVNIGISAGNVRLILPGGDPRAPDSAPSELVAKDKQNRNVQAVWVVPAPTGGTYTLRLFDLDRYSGRSHGSADVKLTVPPTAPSGPPSK